MDLQDAPVTVAPVDGGLRVTFHGPIHTNVGWIEDEINRIVAVQPKVVELDLLATDYISSLGLGLLVDLHNRIKAQGGQVVVIAIHKKTMQMLKIAFLDRLLTIRPDALKE